MTRITDEDLDRLRAFIGNYELRDDLGAQVRLTLLKRCHRQILGALQIWGKFKALSEQGNAKVHAAPILINSDYYECIGEYFSDLIGVLSCLIHGLYKPANMQLRSAIETFVRGVAGVTSLEARQTKNVYRLFEVASQEIPFIGESAPDFATLQQVYGDLCLFVHSATPAHRNGFLNVSVYMRPDTKKMRDLVLILERSNRAVLSIFIRSDKRLYSSCSPKVRDVLDDIIPKDVRLSALGG